MRKLTAAFLALLLFLSLLVPALAEESTLLEKNAGKLQIYCINLKPVQVGAGAHGDCSLIVFPTGETMLVDSSRPEYALTILNWLRELGVTKLDYFWASHYHTDHVGSIQLLADLIPVENYLGPQFDIAYQSPDYQHFLQMKRIDEQRMREGDTLDIGDVHIEVLYPYQDLQDVCDQALIDQVYNLPLPSYPEMTEEAYKYHKDNYCVKQGEMGNVFCTTFKLSYKNFSILFTGDIHMESEQYLLDHYTADELYSTVLKVPHHFVNTSCMPAFIDTVEPWVSVALGDGRWNSWGQKAIRELVMLDLVTGLDGNIEFVTDGETLDVTYGIDERVTETIDGF